ncbi:uncharacterized protein LOC124139301 [Haliotis rufescens]|uniref:uncharacterized protein LOC124139301 n=1 Tax=Haliotis rufescens TaxID=6454 RepID=UPI00201F5E54|nr:uncharacterized protein LOC124139301 [Haliotis rufescens]
MTKQGHSGMVQVIDGKKKPLCRKTACYKFTLFIVAVLLASLIVSCVIVVVLRGQLIEPEKVKVTVGNLELEIKRNVYDQLNNYYRMLDVDGNGTYSLQAAQAHFNSMDKDNNGIVTSKEVADTIGRQYKFIFEAEDFDSDGVIRANDVTDVHKRVDIDDDELVSKDEFAFYHEMARRAAHDRGAL